MVHTYTVPYWDEYFHLRPGKNHWNNRRDIISYGYSEEEKKESYSVENTAMGQTLV